MLALALDDLGERAPYVLFVCGGNVIPGAANAGLADGHGFSGGIRGAAGVLRQEITPSPLRSDRPTSPPANGILRYTGLVTITTETIETLTATSPPSNKPPFKLTAKPDSSPDNKPKPSLLQPYPYAVKFEREESLIGSVWFKRL